MPACGGPSPRVRGKPPRAHDPERFPGSIPACAGETSPGEPRRSMERVHPRVCGGNVTNPSGSRSCSGPSPRVRGKRARGRRGGSAQGSIPACAGETSRGRKCGRTSRVHPRVCGGNYEAALWLAYEVGPSPRVRGKLCPTTEHKRRRSPRRWTNLSRERMVPPGVQREPLARGHRCREVRWEAGPG